MTKNPNRLAKRTPGVRAVLYLRVSSAGQVNTDYDPEGISIPAQRKSCQRKAETLGLEIVEEYIEPGVSGREMTKRVAFQTMLARIRRERDVDYVLVYKLSRMNRNRVDDALVVADLRSLGVTLVSATESIDETPAGQLLHGILASYNEFRSAEDGADIRYKMGEKAKRGGTIGKAPLGYRNVREDFEGRMVASVAIDEDRAPLVRMAFEYYASGDYTIDRLQQTMADLGLRTRGTRRWPSQPVSDSKLRKMLGDPYYTGLVPYKGANYPGRHDALIDSDLFARVQDVITLRTSAGSRDRVHQHHLKGLLFCARCRAHERESRLIFTQARGRSGEYYDYYLCRGRQDGVCDLPYLHVDAVELAVAREYQLLDLPADFAVSVTRNLDEVIANGAKTERMLRQQLDTEIKRIDAAEDRLIDLAAEGGLTGGKVRSRLTQLQLDRNNYRKQLAEIDDSLAKGALLLQRGLALLERPRALYEASTEPGRRLLTQTFFERLWIDEGDVVAVQRRPPFDDVHRLADGYTAAIEAQELKRHLNRAEVPSRDLLQPDAFARHVGSSKTILVDVAHRILWTSSIQQRRRRRTELPRARPERVGRACRCWGAHWRT